MLASCGQLTSSEFSRLDVSCLVCWPGAAGRVPAWAVLVFLITVAPLTKGATLSRIPLYVHNHHLDLNTTRSASNRLVSAQKPLQDQGNKSMV